MDAGVIVEQGPVAEVFLHPKHPTTKRFVQEDEQIDESEQRDDFAHVPGRIVRLTFQGEATYAPLLGTVARETGVDYSILAGRRSEEHTSVLQSLMRISYAVFCLKKKKKKRKQQPSIPK